MLLCLHPRVSRALHLVYITLDWLLHTSSSLQRHTQRMLRGTRLGQDALLRIGDRAPLRRLRRQRRRQYEGVMRRL